MLSCFRLLHPTVLYHGAPINNSDFVGETMDTLEREWSGGADYSGGSDACTVAAFFNGSEGDVTPRRERRDVLETRTRSRQFACAVKSVLETPGQKLNSRVQAGARLIDMQAAPAGPENPRKAVARTPAFGAAALGGGEMDRTFLYTLGWKEGVHRDAQQRQGPKVPALDAVILPDVRVTSLFAPPGHFPKYLPVEFAEIGDLQLGALPVETSTTAAFQMRERFETGGKRFQLIGLANEYASYNATEAEYTPQDYIKASTLWGPKQARFLEEELDAVRRFSEAAATLDIPRDAMDPGAPRRRKSGFGWLILSSVSFGSFGSVRPRVHVGDPREYPDDGLQYILLNREHQPERHLPFFEWHETAANSDADFQAARQRHVSVLAADGHKFDEDADFLKILRHGTDPAHPHDRHWAAIWLRPLWENLGGEYRFEVRVQETTHRSDSFHVDMTKVEHICPCETEDVTETVGPPKLRGPVRGIGR